MLWSDDFSISELPVLFLLARRSPDARPLNSPDGEAKFWLEPRVELAVNKNPGATELNDLTRIVEKGKMKSAKAGTDISEAEVLNVSPHGFWLLVAGKEHFLDFDHFPWFRNASIGQLFKVEFSHGHHLYWPELDVDLDLERIENPGKFPLVARVER